MRAQASRKALVWWSKSREEPWRAQAASPRQSRSNPNFGEKGRHNFLSRASPPCSFFRDDLRDTSMTASANPIQQSFELAAERCEDLTPLVYHRLFSAHPEAHAMFRSEGSELVKGSMLALTIEAILDFAGDRKGSFRLIECEVASHDAYGTPRELFV